MGGYQPSLLLAVEKTDQQQEQLYFKVILRTDRTRVCSVGSLFEVMYICGKLCYSIPFMYLSLLPYDGRTERLKHVEGKKMNERTWFKCCVRF